MKPSVTAGQNGTMADLRRASAQVRWDEGAILRGDFDCDNIPDLAVLGHRDHRVIVGLAWASGAKPDLMEFAVSGKAQMAVCSEDAIMQIESLDEPDDELAGFKPSKTCKGLVLSDGQCDAVHIYWNHDQKTPGWWRN